MLERFREMIERVGWRSRSGRIGNHRKPAREAALPAWATAPTDAYPIGFNPWILHDRLRLTPGQEHRAGVRSR